MRMQKSNKFSLILLLTSLLTLGVYLTYLLVARGENYHHVTTLGHRGFFSFTSQFFIASSVFCGLSLVIVLIGKVRSQISKFFYETIKFISKILYLFSMMLLTITIFYCSVGFNVLVTGNSMNPNIQNNEQVYLEYHPTINRFSVVAFLETNRNQYLVKRVIGLPGDSVSWIDRVLTINGAVVEETFLIDFEFRNEEDFMGTFFYTRDDSTIRVTTIPEGYYFVMGDNRNKDASRDSRHIGLVSKSQIFGVVLYHYPSWTKIT